jgi:hypothetical protein
MDLEVSTVVTPIPHPLTFEFSVIDAGATSRLYIVNNCRDTMSFVMPKIARARLPGESATREFDLEVDRSYKSESIGLPGVSLVGGWTGTACG